MEDIQNQLVSYANDAKISVTKAQAKSFQQYMEILVEWNQKMNLTTITEAQEVLVKHFLDSILLLKYAEIADGASLIDVGTGAGFPGLPLKILRPNLKLTLLDGVNKRLIFLEDVTKRLGIHVELVHARAEEGSHQIQYRGHFDFATARAVAPLNVLCEYCLPYIKMGGTFIAMKGPQLGDELNAAKSAIQLLGCELSSVEEFALPNGDGRSLVLIKRTKILSPLYPRHGAKISKKPL